MFVVPVKVSIEAISRKARVRDSESSGPTMIVQRLLYNNVNLQVSQGGRRHSNYNKKKASRHLITIGTSQGRWQGNWSCDYLLSLDDLLLRDLVEEDDGDVEDGRTKKRNGAPDVLVNLSIQKVYWGLIFASPALPCSSSSSTSHCPWSRRARRGNSKLVTNILKCIMQHASFGLSIDGRVVTAFTRKCSHCCSPYCREVRKIQHFDLPNFFSTESEMKPKCNGTKPVNRGMTAPIMSPRDEWAWDDRNRIEKKKANWRDSCLQVDASFNVWILPSAKSDNPEVELPEIGGDDPSVSSPIVISDRLTSSETVLFVILQHPDSWTTFGS